MKKIFLFIIIFCSANFAQTDTLSTNNGDAHLRGSQPTDNFGSGNYIGCYYNTSTLIKYRSVIKFTIPSGAGTITRISLYLHVNVNDGNPSVRVYQLTSDFDESNVTWDNNWTTPGGDYSETVADATTAPAVGNWQTWDLLGGDSDSPILGLTWGSSIKLLLKLVENTSEYAFYDSKEFTTTSYRPYIKITYTPLATFKPQIIFIE